MGADREGGARRRPMRAVAYAACGVVLLAGCASMPDSGDLRDVESTPRQDTEVRVFAMPPRDNAPPSEIVQGFLEALTSDDPQYATARQYLTGRAARDWRPEQSTTVLANGPDIEVDRATGHEDTDAFAFTLTGSRMAKVDGQQSYTPLGGQYSQPVHLTREKKSGQWRIDGPPRGVVMGQSDFQRNYVSVNKYYFASNTGAEPATPVTAVADPVYVRRRVDAMTQMVRSVLKGPTHWLGQVVRSSFPTGTALREGVTTLTPDDQNKLTVPLNEKASRAGRHQCGEMATQLLFTLRNLTPTVDTVALQRADGSTMCTLDEEHAETFATRGSMKRPAYLYFLDDRRRLVRIADGTGTEADPVPGALGEGVQKLSSAAVSWDERTAAAVGYDKRSLFVGSLVSGGALGNAVVQSGGKTENDRLTPPSWDARGDLWVADRDPARPRLMVLEHGTGEPVDVRVPGLDGRIDAVRVAADGVRIALVVEHKDSKKSLLIGRIERDDKSGDRPMVSVLELRSAAPELEDVTTMSWAGDSRLVVAGREQGGVQTMRYVQVDGSTPEGPAPAALTGVRSIAASEDERLPLVAYSVDGIVRMPAGAQWQKVVKDGSAPVYPG
ncbi:LpqB family beta-propeller domain-containing protein [Streptomyces carpinensis]|uniref:Lipoprotein LpqB n=1 Tax=Streptomyces carpinensis TaxID=66369 RepID=A0ABV1W5P4_9ACTN|nr:LpqB family beta-propeller domain-containing protein [Streptomyces carpinensis]